MSDITVSSKESADGNLIHRCAQRSAQVRVQTCAWMLVSAHFELEVAHGDGVGRDEHVVVESQLGRDTAVGVIIIIIIIVSVN
eukprot:6187449-Pleurochrysis_carterae.AAC.3